AQAAADKTLTTLTLGLGAVALLVGAVGIANTMVISVLERRREIGVRRALGATRWAIGSQFLTESVLLSLIGGLTGAALGVTGTVGYASSQDWGVVVPWSPIALGLLAACLIGTVVGLYPAARAAQVPPTEALRSV
ncbi:MAG: FtsX-like permease family protein, partial [Propionibacteriales bacterium]|nr:FtsX-like permease family protein [Propionibacteriales bacterium]